MQNYIDKTYYAAIYLRLSKEDGDFSQSGEKKERNSIANQRKLIEDYLKHHPELVKKREINCIIVKGLSRFGRDYLEVGDYLEHIFPFLGVRMISVNDRYDSDNNIGYTAGMDVAFKNLIYDYYSKDLSKKVAMHIKQKNGGYVSSCLYGYKVLPQEKHKMVLDPQTAPVVRRVFEEIISGKSSSQVARELNADGIPTTLEYKGIKRKNQSDKKTLWTHHRILEMLGNIKYTGCMVNHTCESIRIRDKAAYRVPKEEWIIHENAHEAIVSKEEFEAAREALRKVSSYKRKSEREVFPFYCAN